MGASTEPESVVLDAGELDALFAALRSRGYRVIGPTLRDRAIVYDAIGSRADLPEGWTDDQDGGRYRLVRRDDEALFGYAVGQDSWKRYLHAPRVDLWRGSRADGAAEAAPVAEPVQPLAFIGVRACELNAIAVQDRVLTGGSYVDPHYRTRREGVFIVALNCGKAGGTCFCVSMDTGPRAETGFDIALTELLDDDGHRFLVEIGTEEGRAVVADTAHRLAIDADRAAADAVVAATAAAMGRQLASDDVHDLLLRNLDHSRWDDVASRCLSCGNCTMVCPTCFCTTVEESSDLTGTAISRSRRWDSCFTMDFSYIHGGSVRSSTKSRYRQWMTHKLATWQDQFGTSGCVGCGRCITWCPVGIDITEEVRAIRDGEPH